MKYRIILMIAPSIGHVNSTLGLAQYLKNNGFEVWYMLSSLNEDVINLGFKIRTCPTYLFITRKEIEHNPNKIKLFKKRIFDRMYNAHVHYTKEMAKAMNEAINELKPDLLLLDSFLVYTFILMNNPKPKTIFIQTMLPTSYRIGIPPLNSHLQFVEQQTRLRKVLVWWKWNQIYISRLIDSILTLGDNPHNVTSRVIKNEMRKMPKMDIRRTFHPVIKDIKEIIMPPASIDWNNAPQIYTGSSFKRPINHIIEDSFRDLMENIEASHEDKVWIYCCLGTINPLKKDYSPFLKEVIKVFEIKVEWELILSMGGFKSNNSIDSNLNNVHIVKKVNQLKILKYCKAIITHGGINTILECIRYSKPMLAYSSNKHWDQRGNINRILYYGLGLSGNLKNASRDEILEKLSDLVQNSDYIRNLRLMKEKIESEDGMTKVLKLIYSFIMKFESLSNSKFDSFRANQILDSFSKITGGSGGTATTYKSGSSSGTDCLDTSTKGTGSIMDGEEVDYNRGSCP